MMSMITVLATKIFSASQRKKRSTQSGFTFIEMLTVTVLIAVMVSIAVVSYVNASKNTRDSRRKQDLAQMQFALEAYKQTYGEYPDKGPGCSGWAYPGCQSSGDWIVGLVPDYLVSLPLDPKQSGGGNMPDASEYSYNYQKMSDTSFYLLVKLENKNDPDLNGSIYGWQGDLYVVTEAK